MILSTKREGKMFGKMFRSIVLRNSLPHPRLLSLTASIVAQTISFLIMADIPQICY